MLSLWSFVIDWNWRFLWRRDWKFLLVFFCIRQPSMQCLFSLPHSRLYHPDSFYLRFLYLPDMLQSLPRSLSRKLSNAETLQAKGQKPLKHASPLRTIFLVSVTLSSLSLLGRTCSFWRPSFSPRELFFSCGSTDEFCFIAVFRAVLVWLQGLVS